MSEMPKIEQLVLCRKCGFVKAGDVYMVEVDNVPSKFIAETFRYLFLYCDDCLESVLKNQVKLRMLDGSPCLSSITYLNANGQNVEKDNA